MQDKRKLAIEVDNVQKIYKLYDKPSDRLKEAFGFGKKTKHKLHYALKGVSMKIYQGETVGIIGTNGSGKSTILKIITGVLNPTSGRVLVNGRISALLELGAGFNMEYNGIENVYLNGTMMGFSEKEIEAIKRSQYEISILRHDMRHFLTNISGYIENGETEKAQEFIREVITATDNTATQCYSKNEVVNLILSSYEEKIKAGGIEFKYSVQIPEELPYSEVDLTAILSNALENAIHAVKKLEEGHGFGSQSIRYVAEKLHGNCQFSVVDDRFVLRVVL